MQYRNFDILFILHMKINILQSKGFPFYVVTLTYADSAHSLIWPSQLPEHNSKMCRICISQRDAIEQKPFRIVLNGCIWKFLSKKQPICEYFSLMPWLPKQPKKLSIAPSNIFLCRTEYSDWRRRLKKCYPPHRQIVLSPQVTVVCKIIDHAFDLLNFKKMIISILFL